MARTDHEPSCQNSRKPDLALGAQQSLLSVEPQQGSWTGPAAAPSSLLAERQRGEKVGRDEPGLEDLVFSKASNTEAPGVSPPQVGRWVQAQGNQALSPVPNIAALIEAVPFVMQMLIESFFLLRRF